MPVSNDMLIKQIPVISCPLICVIKLYSLLITLSFSDNAHSTFLFPKHGILYERYNKLIKAKEILTY